MSQTDSDYNDANRRCLERAKRYFLFKRFQNIGWVLTAIIAAFGFLLFINSNYIHSANPFFDILSPIIPSLFYIFFFGSAFGLDIIAKFLKANVSSEDLLFMDVYAVKTKLDDYFKEKEVAPIYKNQAAKRMKRVTKDLSEGWSTGRLRVVRNIIGNDINAFRRNIKDKLIPSIAKGESDDLKNSYEILKNIMDFLTINPSKELLSNINISMSNLQAENVPESTLNQKISSTISSNSILFSLIICIIYGVAAYFIGLNFNIPMNYIYTGIVFSIPIIFFAMLSYLRKGQG